MRERSLIERGAVFLALAFALSWAVVIGGAALGARAGPAAFVVLVAAMMGPSLAAIVCTFAFEPAGARAAALGLRLRPNVWWLFAWVAPLLLAALSVIATAILGGRFQPDLAAATIAAAERAGQPLSLLQQASLPPTWVLLVISAGLGALINGPLLTFTEELGWRGYLHHCWKGLGFWRFSLITGLIWGLWHAPKIVLFGLNYPNDRWTGVGLFALWCAAISPWLTLVRERGASTFAAGVFHGTLNAVGGLTLLAADGAPFPWNGVVGLGGFLALALTLPLVFVLRRPARAAPEA